MLFIISRCTVSARMTTKLDEFIARFQPSIPSNTHTLLNGDQPMKLVHVDRHLLGPRAQRGFVVSTRTFIQISGDLSLGDRSSLVSRTKSIQFSRVCYLFPLCAHEWRASNSILCLFGFRDRKYSVAYFDKMRYEKKEYLV